MFVYAATYQAIYNCIITEGYLSLPSPSLESSQQTVHEFRQVRWPEIFTYICKSTQSKVRLRNLHVSSLTHFLCDGSNG